MKRMPAFETAMDTFVNPPSSAEVWEAALKWVKEDVCPGANFPLDIEEDIDNELGG